MTGPMSASTNILIEAQRRGAKLRKSGREHVGLVLNAAAVIASPLTPKGARNCRGCGVGGDTMDLVRHVEGVSYPEAVQLLTGERRSSAQLPPRRSPAAANSDPDD